MLDRKQAAEYSIVVAARNRWAAERGSSLVAVRRRRVAGFDSGIAV